MSHIEAEREGFLSWSWSAWGILRRAQDCGSIIVLPTGQPTTVGRGFAFTRRGSKRKAQRALQRWT